MDFEADPINKLKPWKKTICFDFKINQFSLYNAIKVLPKKIEAGPINKLKPLNICFDFKINEISLYNAIKVLPKIGFRSGPY